MSYTTRAAPRYCCCTAACSTSTSSSANCYPGNSQNDRSTRQPPTRPPETRSSTSLDNISATTFLASYLQCLLESESLDASFRVALAPKDFPSQALCPTGLLS